MTNTNNTEQRAAMEQIFDDASARAQLGSMTSPHTSAGGPGQPISMPASAAVNQSLTTEPSDQAIENLAMANGILKSQEHWGVRYYTNKGSDLCRFARALLARYGAQPAASVEPVAWYTDWPGERVYSATPHSWNEPGLYLSADAIADVWHPLYAAPQPAAVPEGGRMPGMATLHEVEAMVSMLEAGEWAEHAGRTPLGQRLEAAITALCNQRPAASVEPARLKLNDLQRRWLKDTIRDAYDSGYSHARNNRAVPGDGAPGYQGRELERNLGDRCAELIERDADSLAPSQHQTSGNASGEPDWLQRLRAEAADLSDRLDRLHQFRQSAGFRMLTGTDQGLMDQQGNQMHALLQTLNQRIHSGAEQHRRSKRHE